MNIKDRLKKLQSADELKAKEEFFDEMKGIEIKFPKDVFKNIRAKLATIQEGAEKNLLITEVYKQLKELGIHADTLQGKEAIDFAAYVHKHQEFEELSVKIIDIYNAFSTKAEKIESKLNEKVSNSKLEAKLGIENCKKDIDNVYIEVITNKANIAEVKTVLESIDEQQKKAEKAKEYDMKGKRIINVSIPIKPKDATNKEYVDGMIQANKSGGGGGGETIGYTGNLYDSNNIKLATVENGLITSVEFHVTGGIGFMSVGSTFIVT